MLTVEVPAKKRSGVAGLWRPMIVAVFSYRYDRHLVPDLIANIAPLVDGWISWDDRQSDEAFSSDTGRRQVLIEAAHAAGAQWVLAVDPDERFEVDAASRIRWLARMPGEVCWTFELKEMYTPTAYRSDGIWGRKRQKRLFPIFDHQFPIPARGSFTSNPLHDAWVPKSYRTLHSRLNLYHLKMIDPARRVARRDLYNALDPAWQYQKVGYDYLADEAGATFEEIRRRASTCRYIARTTVSGWSIRRPSRREHPERGDRTSRTRFNAFPRA